MNEAIKMAISALEKVAIALPSQQIHVFDEHGQALERSLSNDELKALV